MHEAEQLPAFSRQSFRQRRLERVSRCYFLHFQSTALILQFSGLHYPKRHAVGLVRSFKTCNRVTLPEGSHLPLQHLLTAYLKVHYREQGLG